MKSSEGPGQFFDLIDTNNSGIIYMKELENASKRVGLDLNEDDLFGMFEMVCREDEDYITRAQFIEFFIDKF